VAEPLVRLECVHERAPLATARARAAVAHGRHASARRRRARAAARTDCVILCVRQRGATTKPILRLVLAAAILTALFLWSGLDLATAFATLGRLGLGTYLAATAVHLVIYGLRAWRFALLVPRAERPALPAVLLVSAAHNLAAQVLPAKTGELTIIVYLKTRCGVSGSAATASLLVSRLLDVLVLAACGGLASAAVAREHGAGIALLALALLAAAGVGVFMLGRAPRLARALAERTAGRGPRLARLGELATRLGAALGVAGGRAALAPALLVSLPLWILVFVFWTLLAGDLGLPPDVGPLDATFAAALASLAALVPLSTFGGFGPMEAGWKLGFTLVGVEAQQALAVGFAVHLVQLFNVVVLGGLAHLVMALVPGRPARAD
jgi:uncharacterized membrane protein YbhN (UPF0104 family)